MEYQNYRISKLREYLFKIIDNLTLNQKYQINADFLGNVGDFSLDKMPIEQETENWIIGVSKCRDVYSLKSRKAYSSDTINNLKNIGFFEEFESIIEYNNENGILPEIQNIESIKCLNPFTLNYVDETQATFDISIEITYRKNNEREVQSL